jgi:hypothetical protein
MACNCQTQIGKPQTQAKRGVAAKPAAKKTSQPKFISMKYTGPTSARVVGTASGRQYGFARTGTVLQVDPRDKVQLSKVPHLRQI